jgi:hypothetical protein
MLTRHPNAEASPITPPKGLAMARDAKYGLMLWDGKSKGTLNNILNLIAAEKRTLVYLAAPNCHAVIHLREAPFSI